MGTDGVRDGAVACDVAAKRAEGLGTRSFDDVVRRVAQVEIAFGDELEHRHGAAAVGQPRLADDARLDPRTHTARQTSRAVEHQRFARVVAREQPIVGGARRLDHQPGGIGVAAEIVEIDLVGAQQLVDQR